MKRFESEYDVYSPRWGHTDKYYVTFTEDELLIKQGNFSAICVREDNSDMRWDGYNSQTGNPLMKIFSNNRIHAPQIIPLALETAYQKWLDGEVNETNLSEGMDELFEWIDLCSRNKPSGDFWLPIL